MGPVALNRVVRHLRHAAISAGPTDGELLQAFVHRRDEAAFTEFLVGKLAVYSATKRVDWGCRYSSRNR